MMATLPGTVPRMVRPAPGQNYPRTGFPLEGKKNDQTCKTSESDKDRRLFALSASTVVVTQSTVCYRRHAGKKKMGGQIRASSQC